MVGNYAVVYKVQLLQYFDLALLTSIMLFLKQFLHADALYNHQRNLLISDKSYDFNNSYCQVSALLDTLRDMMTHDMKMMFTKNCIGHEIMFRGICTLCLHLLITADVFLLSAAYSVTT